MSSLSRWGPVLRSSATRLGHAAVVLVLVSLGTFLLVSMMPGSPEFAILGENAPPAEYERVRSELGLGDPVIGRYVSWLGGVVQGDFGSSLIPPVEPVSERLARALPVSLQLAVLSLVMALAVAVPAAMFSANRPGGRVDRIVSGTAFGLVSVPTFLSAVVLVLILAVNWQFLPDQLWVRPTQGGWVENLRHAFLPSLAIALTEIGIFTRLLRTDLITTLQEDYILAARSRGMPTYHILLREALRPSSFSLITLIGVTFARLIGGTIIVEQIFALPGLGRLVVSSAELQDVTVVQAAVLVIAVGYIGINALVDVMYEVLDPRIRHSRV